MSDMITRGKALYWGTSEWIAADIRAAWEIADKHHLHKPVMEQPQYHLFHRKRVEQEYARALRRHRPRPDDLEPARQRPADRQVQQGHPGRQPRRAREHVVAGQEADRRGEERGGRQARGHRRRARRERRPDGDRLGREEPARLDVITGASKLAQLRANLLAVDVCRG